MKIQLKSIVVTIFLRELSRKIEGEPGRRMGGGGGGNWKQQ